MYERRDAPLRTDTHLFQTRPFSYCCFSADPMEPTSEMGNLSVSACNIASPYILGSSLGHTLLL